MKMLIIITLTLVATKSFSFGGYGHLSISAIGSTKVASIGKTFSKIKKENRKSRVIAGKIKIKEDKELSYMDKLRKKFNKD